MKKSTKTFKNDSIFVQLMVSTTISYILFGVGAFFVFFLSPEGDPLNKGENGNGSWNLWVGILIWVVMVLLYFFKDKLSQVDFDNDPELKKIDRDIQDTKDPELKKSKLEERIENDPVLNKLDAELYDINRSYIPKLQKIKDTQPESWKQLVKYGLVDPKDFK